MGRPYESEFEELGETYAWSLKASAECFAVYHLVQYGYSSAVASFGASLSDAQAKLLLSTGRPVVLMYDGGEPGRSAMRQAAAKLITQTLVKAVKLPEGVKPDDLSGDELACWLPS